VEPTSGLEPLTKMAVVAGECELVSGGESLIQRVDTGNSAMNGVVYGSARVPGEPSRTAERAIPCHLEQGILGPEEGISWLVGILGGLLTTYGLH
jgi:hypothetical protein